ncbi:MAG TPA: phage holin family protein [Gammaproteobacteria bacterium]|nr:phage holin family protein [Gammaproteobacteria bacterium]
MPPGVRVDSYGTALLETSIYGFINETLGATLKLLSLPFVILTLSVFLIVIDKFLLWLTDKILGNFEIDDHGTTFIAALLITSTGTLLAQSF